MAKTAKLRLLDAIEAIASINSFIGSLPLEDFLANEMVQAAVLFKLGVFGEALNKAAELDHSLREAIPNIGKIIGMRNRIVHAYRSDRLRDFVGCHSFGSAGPEDQAGELPGRRRERMTCKHQQIAVNLRRLGYEF